MTRSPLVDATPIARLRLVRGLALLLAGALFVLTGEVTLRIFYRDGGRRTFGGPGNRSFEHLTIGREALRGRRDVGPHRPGVPRLMVLGDSITYGQGVHDWHNTWPELLATRLEREGHPYELAMFAEPGRDMPAHLEELERWGPVVRPDVLLYQWYVNDVEVMPHRPDETRVWQRWAGHAWLQQTSYLYYFLDHRARALLPPPGRSYADYILQDFHPGTAEWSEFERCFHAFAVRAAQAAARRIMILYPQVPYRDRYPLQSVHDLMKTLASPHMLSIPPTAWIRSAGTMDRDAAAPWALVSRVTPGLAATFVETREYLVVPGMLRAQVVASVPELADASAAIGTLDVVDAVTGETVASGRITAQGGMRGYQTLAVTLDVPGTEPRRLRLRVATAGKEGWSLASLGLAVNDSFEVVDLAEPLNRFNTHTSLFDAHPNEAAHRVMADAVYHVLRAE
jgi:hypothetical protein